MAKKSRPDPEIVAKYVELQAQTACRKCKKKEWTLEEGFGLAQGGDRVGIFVVLGPSSEVVATAAFTCKGCGAKFERPVYTREQLAAQEYPAVQLDAKLEDAPEKKNPGNNGKL